MAEHESYKQSIDSAHKGCVLFLIDQSYSMIEPIGNSQQSKCDLLAKAVNRWLETMVIINSDGEDEYKDRWDIGVFGYRTDLVGNPIVERAMSGVLGENDFSTIAELATNSEREPRQEVIFDKADGETHKITTDVPVWLRPMYEGGTPLCHALYRCYEVLDAWIQQHSDSFPPLLIHFTDGENTDETDDGRGLADAPLPYADALKGLATNDGNVLILNCHLSMTPADAVMFPNNSESLSGEHALMLFRMSSVIPQRMRNLALEVGFEFQHDTRAMVFDADTVSLLSFLDVSTRVATMC